MIHTLENIKAELQALRRRNELLEAQVEIVNLFKVAFQTNPASCGPMGVDPIYHLDRLINDLRAKEEREKNRTPGANHFCPGESGAGEWSCRSEDVPSKCGYCGEPNEALRKSQENAQ